MSDLKVFVTREGRATFVCPQCECPRTVEVSRNAQLAGASRVRVKCPCGHQYPVTLERRRFFRKAVNLNGRQLASDRLLSGGLSHLPSRVSICRRVSLIMARDNPAVSARIPR